MRKLIFIFVITLLSACSFIPIPTPNPADQIVFNPSATPSLVPSATATPIPPTVSPTVPTATTDANFYRDDFNGTLAAPWKWVREDPENWSLTKVPGVLQINVGGGYVSAHTNFNLLLRPAPAGNFQIETQITFSPENNFQFAGLIIYQSDSDFIQAGRGYCRTFECVGEGLYMNLYKNGKVVQPDFGQRYKEINPVLLRLSRQADTYTFEASTNGKVWFVIGSHTSDMNPSQIGLVSGQKLKGNAVPANFDYFEVRSLP
jgi:beta-xylosidase